MRWVVGGLLAALAVLLAASAHAIINRGLGFTDMPEAPMTVGQLYRASTADDMRVQGGTDFSLMMGYDGTYINVTVPRCDSTLEKLVLEGTNPPQFGCATDRSGTGGGSGGGGSGVLLTGNVQVNSGVGSSFFWFDVAVTDEDAVEILVSVPAGETVTFSSLHCETSSALASGVGYTFRVRKNQSDSDLVCTATGDNFPAENEACADVAHTVTLSPGDEMAIKTTAVGAPGAGTGACSLGFVTSGSSDIAFDLTDDGTDESASMSALNCDSATMACREDANDELTLNVSQHVLVPPTPTAPAATPTTAMVLCHEQGATPHWCVQSTPDGAGGATTWVGLTDTAGSITASTLVQGNAGGTALEMSNTLVNDLTLDNAGATSPQIDFTNSTDTYTVGPSTADAMALTCNTANDCTTTFSNAGAGENFVDVRGDFTITADDNQATFGFSNTIQNSSMTVNYSADQLSWLSNWAGTSVVLFNNQHISGDMDVQYNGDLIINDAAGGASDIRLSATGGITSTFNTGGWILVAEGTRYVEAPVSGDIGMAAYGVTTIQPDSVDLTAMTTGNYVASITNGTSITGGDGGSEGAALTLDVADDTIDGTELADTLTLDTDWTWTAGDSEETTLNSATDGDGTEASLTVAVTMNDDADALDNLTALQLDLTRDSGDAGDVMAGLRIRQLATANDYVVKQGIILNNLEDAVDTMTTGIDIVGGTTDSITTAIDLSDNAVGIAIALGTQPITTSASTLASTELDRLDGLAGIIATDETAVTGLEGTNLSITAGVLNATIGEVEIAATPTPTVSPTPPTPTPTSATPTPTPAPIHTEGRIQWDPVNDFLLVGDGTVGQRVVGPLTLKSGNVVVTDNVGTMDYATAFAAIVCTSTLYGPECEMTASASLMSTGTAVTTSQMPSRLVNDDTLKAFGTNDDVSIEYDEDGTDEGRFAGSWVFSDSLRVPATAATPHPAPTAAGSLQVNSTTGKATVGTGTLGYLALGRHWIGMTMRSTHADASTKYCPPHSTTTSCGTDTTWYRELWPKRACDRMHFCAIAPLAASEKITITLLDDGGATTLTCDIDGDGSGTTCNGSDTRIGCSIDLATPVEVAADSLVNISLLCTGAGCAGDTFIRGHLGCWSRE